ncbi:chromate transporter [Leptolyngbyaceae cyanobacterium UHCC 1019]
MENRDSTYSELSPTQQRQRLKELAIVFLKLGAIAFGGPAAHISMMDEEIVERRQWISREKLLDLLGITNLIPGPNSTELAIHIGYERGGLWGLAIAGCCFILPAMLIVWGLAAVYVQTQAIPQVGWLLYGIKAVIVAIVVQALWKLGQKALKDTPTIVAAIAVTIASFLGINEILLLLLGGIAVMLFKNWKRRRNLGNMGAWMVPMSAIAQVTTVPSATPAPTGLSIFLFFLKIGCVLYGSGYVLLAFLQTGLVDQRQWLTSQQLLDAIAIGQFTPGPVFTTATFIGYLLGGNSGAIAATVGIFLPAFVLVVLVNPWVPKLRQSSWASGFLDGVNAASMGLMASVTYVLARTALVDWVTIAVAILSAIAVFRFKINSAWLVFVGGMIGFLAKQLLPV